MRKFIVILIISFFASFSYAGTLTYTTAEIETLLGYVNGASAYGRTLWDDANAAAARTTLGVYSSAEADSAFLEATQLNDTKGNGDTTYIWSADKVFDQLALKLDDTQLDDTKGNGDTTYMWSADKIYDQLALKQGIHAALTSISGLTETLGGLPYGTADNTYAWLAAGATGKVLIAKGAAAPEWTPYTFPATVPTVGKVLISDGTNLIGSTALGTGAYATIADYAPLASPSFTTPTLGVASATSIDIGAADTTLAREDAGELSVEGSHIYHTGDEATIGAALVDDNITDTLTASKFAGTGSTTDAVDLATGEVSGVLDETNIDSAIARDTEADTLMNATTADTAVMVSDGDNSKTIKATPVLIDGSGNLTGVGTVTQNASATPGFTGTDSDYSVQPFQIYGNANDANDAYSYWDVLIGASLTHIITLDGVNEKIIAAKHIVPNADGTLDLGVQTSAQWANVWADAINGADYTFLNKWRLLESEKYKGYPKGIAIGDEGFKDGVVTEKMPEDVKPIFVVTKDFIEYKGVRVTKEILEKLIKSLDSSKN
jgi:hypothetical protein